MRNQIDEGRQIFVVYPLIQESEKMDYKNLEDGWDTISRVFPARNTASVLFMAG
jgi:ATP-dependent DNA helicase RecG